MRIAFAVALVLALPGLAGAATPDERFREANELMRGRDYPKAIAIYEELAASGAASAALYWNWAQAASARGATGEALWALLRARELAPSDPAVAREIERLREVANLDRAELAPEPLATAARTARQYRLGLIAAVMLLLSLALHGAIRWRDPAPRLVPLTWTALVVGLLAALLPVAGAFARPTATVIHRGTPLLEAASPTAEPVGTLREGEVVPILEASGDYVRIEDSSGARGWARTRDVRVIDAGR